MKEPIRDLEERIEQLKKEIAQRDDIISYYKGNEAEIKNIINNKNKEISRLTVEIGKLKEEIERRNLNEI